MIFQSTPLVGVYVIEPELLTDFRGSFARTWCKREFERHGLNPRLVQCNISFNRRKGTLRGMHYQEAPFAEAKLIRCTRGAIFDVALDLRPDSSTFRRHFAAVLSAENRKMLYIPEGYAHGFQTLEDDTEVFYQMSEYYTADYGRGVRWNDPTFAIPWPEDERTIIDRDNSYPDFRG
ncbi:MAG: dTDP-4-dehydrorhamnose 3,5-epimerase [Chloroflexota bacterium]